MSDNNSSESTEVDGVQVHNLVEQSANNKVTHKADQIAEEVPIAFAYNGQSHAVMMASPTDLNDFAVGFSITERIVDQAEQIRNIEVLQAKQGFTVQLDIEKSLMTRLDEQKRQMSGRTSCGICGISDLAAAIPKLNPMAIRSKPDHSVIDQALNIFPTQQKMQQATGATHCAALFDVKGQLLELREDIGRHNALDKLIGARLSHPDKAFNEGDFLVLSSRASHELITKAVIAGVGSLVCISAATSLAIEMATKLNLNLIGFIRGERQIIYYQN